MLIEHVQRLVEACAPEQRQLAGAIFACSHALPGLPRPPTGGDSLDNETFVNTLLALSLNSVSRKKELAFNTQSTLETDLLDREPPERSPVLFTRQARAIACIRAYSEPSTIKRYWTAE